MKVGAHVEVFERNARTGEQELVHTSRPGEVCGRCGVEFERVGLVIPNMEGTPTCPGCKRGA